MKTAIIIADGVKQIMFTPENDSEKEALKLLSAGNQNISVDFKTGHFYDRMPPSAHGYMVRACAGGYLRAYDSEESLMIVLTPKSIEPRP